MPPYCYNCQFDFENITRGKGIPLEDVVYCACCGRKQSRSGLLAASNKPTNKIMAAPMNIPAGSKAGDEYHNVLSSINSSSNTNSNSNSGSEVEVQVAARELAMVTLEDVKSAASSFKASVSPVRGASGPSTGNGEMNFNVNYKENNTGFTGNGNGNDNGPGITTTAPNLNTDFVCSAPQHTMNVEEAFTWRANIMREREKAGIHDTTTPSRARAATAAANLACKPLPPGPPNPFSANRNDNANLNARNNDSNNSTMDDPLNLKRHVTEPANNNNNNSSPFSLSSVELEYCNPRRGPLRVLNADPPSSPPSPIKQTPKRRLEPDDPIKVFIKYFPPQANRENRDSDGSVKSSCTTVIVTRNTTVGKFRRKVQDATGIEAGRQCLRYDNTTLEGADLTLGEVDVEEDGVFILMERPEGEVPVGGREGLLRKYGAKE